MIISVLAIGSRSKTTASMGGFGTAGIGTHLYEDAAAPSNTD